MGTKEHLTNNDRLQEVAAPRKTGKTVIAVLTIDRPNDLTTTKPPFAKGM